jgi:hypothetical protein
MDKDTIDVTPSWAETANMLLTIIERSSNVSDINYAKSEILRMGKIIDELKS